MGMHDEEPRINPAPIVIVDKPKVKLIRNAKGDPQWEITVVEGTSAEQIAALRTLALHEWKELEYEILGVTRP